MGVSLKTENEECSGETMQIRGSEGGRRGLTGTPMQGFRRQVLQHPSARLTHGLKRATGQRLLRCSVLRETPMTSAISIQFQKAKMLQTNANEKDDSHNR